MNRFKRKLLAVISALGFLGFVWWSAWLLRAGPDGPYGWTFGPIIVTGTALFILAVFLLVFAFSSEGEP